MNLKVKRAYVYDGHTCCGISIVMHTDHRDASRNPEATCNSRRYIHLPFGYPISFKYSKYFRYQRRPEGFASVETPAWRIVAVSQQNIFMRDILLTFLRLPLHAKYCLLSPAIADGVSRKSNISIAVTVKIYDDSRRRPFLNSIKISPSFRIFVKCCVVLKANNTI